MMRPIPALERGRESSEMAEESGEGASEAEGLVGGGEKVIWMPCVPIVQSRYDVASSKSVRSDILAQHSMYQAPVKKKHPTPTTHTPSKEKKEREREREKFHG
jgi:hypothetical protein